MTHATLTLFGRFQLLVDNAPVTFATEHSRALLAYLAVQPGTHERAMLAVLLWPERPEAVARQNLRQTLVSLKRSLHPFPSLNTLLVITPKSIELSAETLATDVQSFSQLWATCAAHTHSQLVTCEACIGRLQQAARLYTGELLSGLFIKNSPSFEEWLLFLRERMHRQALEILNTLTLHHEIMADYSQMQHSARRQLALEPWNEETHRHLMRALALCGQSTAALAHYGVCQRTLAEELGVPPSAATTALYEEIKRGDFDGAMRQFTDQKLAAQERNKTRQEVATENDHLLPAQALVPNTLPSPLTPIVGRGQEIGEIIQRLAAPATRLLTLVGLGGIGKTRLAIEVAQLLHASHLDKSPLEYAFRDGCFFVSLASLSSSAALAPTIAATLGIEPSSDPRQSLINNLHSKAALLILDNFEHLLDGVPLLIELLEQASYLKILVTSRERLNVRVEQLYTVPPLLHAQQGEFAEATTLPAVSLFIERARRVSPNFQATESNLPVLLRICELVQGMPLGLEMAAAWCSVLSLDEIAVEIEQGIDFLAVDYSDLPERHRSIRNVFDWSWRLLAEEEALVLRQLAVFRGGFTRQAAEIVCGATLRVLNGLVNKSLLRRSLDTSENPRITTGRYEFHPLLWQFAQEKLYLHPEELKRSTGRHSTFYLAFVAERERRLMRHEPRQAMIEIQAELDNVRQAWSQAVDERADEVLDLSAYGMWQFYLMAGLTAEAVEAFEQAVTVLMSSVVTAHTEVTVLRQQPILSKLCAVSAHLLSLHGNNDAAIINAQRAITLAIVEPPEATSRQATALGHLAMGQALYYKNQFSEAQTHLEQGLRIVQAEEMVLDEIWPEISVLVRLYLGAIARTRGDYALAYGYLSDALSFCQQEKKVRAEVRVQMNLGVTARAMRDGQRARQAYEQVLPLAAELHDRWGEGVARHELGEVVRELGEYSLAFTLYQQALAIFVDSNERMGLVGQGYSLSELIKLSTCLGQFEQASRYQVQLASLLPQMKAPDAERASLVASAMLAHYQGDDEQALVCAQQLWQLVQPMNTPRFQAETLLLLGHAQSGLCLQVVAAESYTQALTLYQSLNMLAQAAEALVGLADLALGQGEPTRALQLIEEVFAILEQYPNAGVYAPFLIYSTCYKVLAATHDPRSRPFLKKAQALLQSYAAHIHTKELRDSFLQNVSVHRQLVVAYEEAAKEGAI